MIDSASGLVARWVHPSSSSAAIRAIGRTKGGPPMPSQRQLFRDARRWLTHSRHPDHVRLVCSVDVGPVARQPDRRARIGRGDLDDRRRRRAATGRGVMACIRSTLVARREAPGLRFRRESPSSSRRSPPSGSPASWSSIWRLVDRRRSRTARMCARSGRRRATWIIFAWRRVRHPTLRCLDRVRPTAASRAFS